MGFFNNKDKDDLQKHSKKMDVEEDEEEEEVEEEEEDTESEEEGPCSMKIYVVENSSEGLDKLENLSKEQLKELRKECRAAGDEGKFLNLEKYGYNTEINGKYIVSFDWEEDD